MRLEKKHALAEFHRAQILTAAGELFSKQGFDKTTMDEIAKAADYSKATLYVYFKSKDDIINHLTHQSMTMLYTYVHEALLDITDFFACYKKLCYALVKYQAEYPLYFDIALSPINIDLDNPETPPIFKSIYETGEAINSEVKLFLIRGIELNYIKSDLPILPTIFWLWGSLAGIIKINAQKNAYIAQDISLHENEFLDYSFKLLLNSILKEGVVNAY